MTYQPITPDRIIGLLVDADLHAPDEHATAPAGFTAEADGPTAVVLHYLGESTSLTQSKLTKASDLLAWHRYQAKPQIRAGRFCLEITKPAAEEAAS